MVDKRKRRPRRKRVEQELSDSGADSEDEPVEAESERVSESIGSESEPNESEQLTSDSEGPEEPDGPKRSWERATISDLMLDLESRNSKRREKAAHALGARGTEAQEAVPQLAELLSDEKEAVRLRTARALGKIGPDAAAAVPALIAALKDGTKDRSRDSKSVAGVSAHALKKIGAAAVPDLLRALLDEGLHKRALRVLKSISIDERPEIGEALGEVLGASGRAGVGAVRALEAHKEQATLLLLQAVGARKEVRDRALKALQKMGRAAVPKLASSLDHDDSHMRAAAAQALGVIAREVSQRAVARVLSRLLDALFDEEEEVRAQVVETLGRMSDHEDRVLPGLIDSLGDDASSVSLQAVMSLLDVTSDRKGLAARMTGVLEKEKDAYTRVGACMVLMHLGQDARETVPELLEALEDSSTEVREYAHLAIQAIRTPSMKLEVIRTASMRLKVVDDEDDEDDEPPRKGGPPPRKRKRAAGVRRRRGGARRRR